MKLRRGALLSTLLATLAGAPAAQATSASVFGIGPKTRAWAGAGASQAAGYESAFQNPAALALSGQLSLSAGYGVESAWLYSQRAREPEQRFESRPRGSALLGFTLPLGVFGQRFVLGFASSSPGGSVARADLPWAEQPQFPLLLGRQQAVDFDLALGVRPLRFLALGVGLRALSTLLGSAEVDQSKKTTTTRVTDTLEPVLAPSAGVSAFFGPKATLALVARAPLRADFDMRLAAVDLGATQLPPLNLAGVAHYDPLAVQLEYAQRLGSFEAMVGAVYQRFRSTPALLPRTVSCPPARPACLALDVSSPGFHDTVDLHFAATLGLPLTRSAEAQLRAGYAFVPSPVPDQSGAANLLDNGRHRFGLGYGLTLKAPLPPVALDGALTLDRLVPRTSHKAPNVAAENAGAPWLTTRGHTLGLSLGLTVRL
jgi:long-chain fatty acid transport protein